MGDVENDQNGDHNLLDIETSRLFSRQCAKVQFGLKNCSSNIAYMSDDIMKMWAGHCQRGEMSPPSPPLGPLLGPLLGTVMPLGAKAQCKPRDCFRQAYSIVKRGFKLSICCVQNTK